MAQLIVTTPKGEETLLLDPGTVVTIGRDPSNRIPLEGDTQVSRRHCRIAKREGEAGGFEVVDLGSTNKTRVNGAPIKRRALSHGDLVEVGSAKLCFEDADESKRLADAEKDGVCYLEWADKDRKGERVLLSKNRVTIGRRETNTIVLDDRMASAHHCEIDRDVNGYTLRDLGSTNGTLVNGEAVTESLLAHGNRVRVGNSRFVFKDPTMKDVEVELSQFEEDEGWGMMADIDLSRAPGSRSGALVAFLLMAAAAAGGFYLFQQGERTRAASGSFLAGLVENGDFEGEEVLWSAAEPGVGSVSLEDKKGQKRSRGLVAKATGEASSPPSLVTYDSLIETSPGHGIRLEASFKKIAGDTADLVVIWMTNPTSEELKQNLVSRLERVDPLVVGKSSWQRFQRRLVGPTWARAAKLGIWLAPGARAVLDDVDVRMVGLPSATASLDVPTFKKAVVDGKGAVDLLQSRVVLLTGAVPVARLPGGEVLSDFQQADGPPAAVGGGLEIGGTFPRTEGEAIPARITWRKTTEGLEASFTCEGAEAVGLSVALPQQHLEGAISVLGDFPPRRIPAQPGQRVEKVEQTLAGRAETLGSRPPTLVAFVQADDQPIATLVIEAGRGRDLLRVIHWVEGSAGSLALVTDFSQRRETAREDLRKAVASVRADPVRAFDELRRVIQLYPFEPGIREEAIRKLGELEERVNADTQALDDALADFRHYGSAEALGQLESSASTMRERFLSSQAAGERKGPIVQRIRELVAASDEAGQAWRLERIAPSVDRLERLVKLLADVPAYQPVAAVYARALRDRYGALAAGAPDLARRLEAMKVVLDKLQDNEGVRDAMPPVPGGS